MKFFRLDLLTLLISLFILNSCKNQDTVNLGISTTQPNGSLVDTSTIVVNTIPEDSVVTSGPLAKTPLGYFKDPIFGTTQADIASDLNLPGQLAYSLPSGTVTIDSARLILKYADGFYGDSLSSIYRVNVYQLNEKFSTSAPYYNTKKWNVNYSNLLGSLTFNARTHDSIKIYSIITGAPDTLIKVGPQLRIPISSAFINNNLFTASTTTLGSNAIFNNNVKGLYITIDQTKTTGPGGTFMVASTDTVGLTVYYKAVNGATIDTNQVTLPLVNFASSITHTYSTAIQTELNNQTSSRGIIYLQGLAGLRAKISFPNLLANLRKGLLATGDDIVINRAELVLTANPGTNIPYQPLPKLSMYRYDLAHQRIELEDATTTDPRSGGLTVFGGYYSKTTKQYHFIITAYLQDLLLKKTVDYGTFIAPIDTTNTASVDIAATPQVAARTVAVGSNPASPYTIKLNIIYTKVPK